MARILNSTASEGVEASNQNDNENNDIQGKDNFLQTFLVIAVSTYATLTLLYLIKTKCKIFLSGHQASRNGSYNNPTHRCRSSYYPIPNSRIRFFDRLRRCFRGGVTGWKDYYPLGLPVPNQFQLDERNYRSWSVLQVASWMHSKLILSKVQTGILQQRISQYANNNIEHVLIPLNSSPTTTSSICCFSTNDHEGDFFQIWGDRGCEQDPGVVQCDEMSIHPTIQSLMQQMIDGGNLQHLSLDRLNNFGIPFGIAVQIMTHLQDLIPMYSRRDPAASVGELPSWYENAEFHSSHLGNTDNSKGNPTANDYNDEGQHAITDRAQQLMKDRFGISLPNLRNQNEMHHEDNVDVSAGNDGVDIENGALQTRSKTRQISSTSSPNGSEIDRGTHWESENNPHARHVSDHRQKNDTGISNVLNAMPPRIRAVAARRPDLVAKLMAERQRQLQPQPQPRHPNRFGTNVAPGPNPLPSISEAENDASAATSGDQGRKGWLERTDSTLMAIPSGHKLKSGNARFRGLELECNEDDDDESNYESVSLLRRVSGSKEQ